MNRSFAVAGLLGASVLLAHAPVHAQSPRRTSASPAVSHVASSQRALAAGDAATAVAEARLAVSADGGSPALLALARGLEAQGWWEAARTEARRCAENADRSSTRDPDAIACWDLLQSIRDRAGFVIVSRNTRLRFRAVRVGAELLPDAVVGEPMAVRPGDVVVTAERPDGTSVTQTLHVEVGQRMEARLPVDVPAPNPAVAPSPSPLAGAGAAPETLAVQAPSSWPRTGVPYEGQQIPQGWTLEYRPHRRDVALGWSLLAAGQAATIGIGIGVTVQTTPVAMVGVIPGFGLFMSLYLFIDVPRVRESDRPQLAGIALAFLGAEALRVAGIMLLSRGYRTRDTFLVPVTARGDRASPFRLALTPWSPPQGLGAGVGLSGSF